MQRSVGSVLRSFVVPVTIGIIALLIGSTPAQAQDASPEARFLSLVNDYRQESERCWIGDRWRAWSSDDARSLARSSTLDQAAEAHNVAMIEGNCFAHQCSGESDLPERVDSAGYPPDWRYLSENIAGGFERAQTVFRAWQNSASHNRTMLDCRSRAIGIARTDADQSPYRWYWTTDFGDVVDADASRRGDASSGDDAIATIREYDANGNDRVDRNELLEIVAAWNAGRLGDTVVETAYELYRSGEALGGASRPELLSVNRRADRATFVVNGLSARNMDVRIYGLSGELVYAGRTSDAELVWGLQNRWGQPVANGVYLYVVEAETPHGSHRRVGRMTVLR